MLYVSIFVELIRSRPALAVWIAVILQAALWFLLPAIFYTAPPGDVPAVLAIGHEFQLGTYLGPPLAFWLAEVAYDIAGGRMIGVYLLSQLCVIATYWAVFTLGRAIVGPTHAALAVMLMAGVAAFTIPTPDFGPVILTMPLWSVILLHYWRAVGENRRGYWLVLAIEIGLLLLTTYVGLILIGLLVLFTIGHPRARRTLRTSDPWIAAAVAVIVTLPHLVWLIDTSSGIMPVLARLRAPEAVTDNFMAWLRQIGIILTAHAGLVILSLLVAGWPWPRSEPAPVIVRPTVDPFARQYIYFFAILPAFAGTLAGVLIGVAGPVGGVAPLVVLSGLLVVVAAGDAIHFGRQHIVIATWFGLVLIPPVMTVVALYAAPWFNVDLKVTEPAGAMGRFFAESFERRVGAPLRIVAGDPRTAALVALGPTRPSLFLNASPQRSPWVTPEMLRTRGAIVVWPTTDTAGAPPDYIKASFPDLVPEVPPRSFPRAVQGRLPMMRIGWGVIRPQTQPPAPPAPGTPPAAPKSQ